jgi:hypothetical protein
MSDVSNFFFPKIILHCAIILSKLQFISFIPNDEKIQRYKNKKYRHPRHDQL